MSSFRELGLSAEIVTALDKLGYEQPTDIQAKTIPFLLTSNQDLKAFAQTGTGKTAAFSLPIIEQLDTESSDIQALILSPTRELAIQIEKNIQEFSSSKKQCKSIAIYGGANIDEQIRKLKKGIQIVVGTPGRTVDLLKRKQLDFSNVKWLVLDEADEMLNMGFKEDIDTILEKTPKTKQTLLFSATFPKEVEDIAKNYMNNAVELTTGKKNKGSDNVSHQYYVVSERNRYAALKRIADVNPSIYAIIFCRTRRETQEVADKLIKDGYNADALHGDLSQAQRDSVMDKFRKQHLQLLVATDVAARGLDVNNLTHVINYKLPDQTENYTHRSGRTGRAGNEGVSIAIVTGREKNKLHPIEKIIGKQFEKTPIPTGKEICQNQLFKLIDKVHDIEINEAEIKEFLPTIYQKLEDLDREELIKRFVSIEFNTFLSYYENAPDLNDSEHMRSSFSKNDVEMSRFFINLGKRDKLNPARLIGLLNEQKIAKNIEIGQIEILDNFSFFEFEATYESSLLDVFEKSSITFEGRTVNIEKTTKKKGGKKGGKNKKSTQKRQGKKEAFNFPPSTKKSKRKGRASVSKSRTRKK